MLYALILFPQSLHHLEEFGKARDFLIRAQRIKPQDKEINTQLEKLNKLRLNIEIENYLSVSFIVLT